MYGKQLQLGEEVKENLDEHKNRWYLDGNVVLLKLASESHPRKIGVLFDKRLIVYRNREKHLMKQNDSYGFNEQVVTTLEVEYIDLYEEEIMYRIPKHYLLTKGRDFEGSEIKGFEKQLFLPISEIEAFVYVTPEDEKRIELLGKEWFYKLKEEFHKDYMILLARQLAYRRSVGIVYPEKERMFRAYKTTPFNEVRVVILGQDPYYTKDVADGLAFSSGQDLYIPPSLQQIYRSIEKDIKFGLFLDQNPNLQYLAEQGVFLLNRVLTVEKGIPGAHGDEKEYNWQRFTNKTLQKLKEHPRDLVVMLWGSEAKKCKELVDNGRHLILEAEHPANAGRQERDWEHGECFTKANKFLQAKGYGIIEW